MFKNVWGKTLHEKRFFTLFWFLGVIAMTLLTMSFYPSFKQGGFDEAYKSLPKNVQALTGSLVSIKTVPGYISQQIYAFRIPLLTLIMSITMFAGLIAGDESEGTLQTLLAQPVSRLKVFVEKYLAGLIIALIVCFGSVIGVFIALALINEYINFMYLLAAMVDAWLLVMLFGTLAFAIGAMTGRKALAGGVTSLIAFGAFLITSLAPNVAVLKQIEKFLPFYYYNNPATAINGLSLSNVLVLASVTMILLIVSLTVFMKRDIYQK